MMRQELPEDNQLENRLAEAPAVHDKVQAKAISESQTLDLSFLKLRVTPFTVN